MSEETIKYTISCILEDSENVSRLPRNEFNDAKRLAYYEILSTIKGQFQVNNIDLKDYGLDFELESIL